MEKNKRAFAVILVSLFFVIAVMGSRYLSDRKLSRPVLDSSTITASDEESIRKAYVVWLESSGFFDIVPSEKVKIDVRKIFGPYASGDMYVSGSAGIVGEPGGGYYFALKRAGKWSIVLVGNGIPTCDEVRDIPSAVIDQCLGVEGSKEILKDR